MDDRGERRIKGLPTSWKIRGLDVSPEKLHLIGVDAMKVDRGCGDELIPGFMYESIKAQALHMVQADGRLTEDCFLGDALYAFAIMISEWILHITGTKYDVLDQKIEIWSTISRHYAEVEVKKQQILALGLQELFEPTNRKPPTRLERKQANIVLEEINKIREGKRNQLANNSVGILSKSEKEEQVKNSMLKTPKQVLSPEMYIHFSSMVDVKLFDEPMPEQDDYFKWLEWTKNRWKYKRTFKQFLYGDLVSPQTMERLRTEYTERQKKRLAEERRKERDKLKNNAIAEKKRDLYAKQREKLKESFLRRKARLAKKHPKLKRKRSEMTKATNGEEEEEGRERKRQKTS